MVPSGAGENRRPPSLRGTQSMSEQQLESSFGEAQALRKGRMRRSTLEVRMDILIVVRDGARGPTQIMFRANLSWNLLTDHLKELVANGILFEEKVKNRASFRLTDKGITVLRSYMTVADNLDLPDHYAARPPS
jgi:predicted transcriptional regulator